MNTDGLNLDLISLAFDELDASRAQQLRGAIERDATLAARFAHIQSMLSTLREGVLLMPPATVVARALAIVQNAPSPRPLAWLESAATLIARVLHDSLGAAPLAGFRGESEGRHMSCTSGSAQIELLVDESFDEQTQQSGVVVHGQIAGAQAGEVAACSPGTTLALSSATVAAGGTFTLRIGASESDLLIRTATGAIRVNGIKAR